MGESSRKILHAPVVLYIVVAAVGAAAAIACQSVEGAHLRAGDSTITTDVKAALAADSDLNPFHIDVTTKDRVVTLQGRVKTEDAREKAERMARETDGVQRVVNLVKVGDPQ
jgi:hyperosmotically inducible periplasmic protein